MTCYEYAIAGVQIFMKFIPYEWTSTFIFATDWIKFITSRNQIYSYSRVLICFWAFGSNFDDSSNFQTSEMLLFTIESYLRLFYRIGECTELTNRLSLSHNLTIHNGNGNFYIFNIQVNKVLLT